MPKRATTSAAGSDSPQSSYLRRKTPVPVRRKVFGNARPWLLRALLLFVVAGAAISAAYALNTYLRGCRYFLWSGRSESLRVDGLHLVAKQSIEKVFQADAGASVFAIPLRQRRQEIQQIAWVRNAVLRRIGPNRLWTRIQERQPVAFVRFPRSPDAPPHSPKLIDSEGVLLVPPPGQQFAFPVLTGISAAMPLPDRRKRVALYQALISDLDRVEPYYSSRVSEVDVLDPRNAKVTTVFDGEMVHLQMGDENFRHRFQVFLQYFDSWKKEFGRVRSVDLRYKGVVATE